MGVLEAASERKRKANKLPYDAPHWKEHSGLLPLSRQLGGSLVQINAQAKVAREVCLEESFKAGWALAFLWCWT